MGKIVLKRDSGYADRARKYKLICNGKVLGTILNGETKEFITEQTDLELFLKIDWCRSNKLKIHLEKNQIKSIYCGSSLREVKLLFGMIYALFMPHKYLWVKDES